MIVDVKEENKKGKVLYGEDEKKNDGSKRKSCSRNNVSDILCICNYTSF